LIDLHSNLNPILIDEYVKKSKDLIDTKINDYVDNKNNVKDKVEEYIIGLFKNVKDNAVNICKKITNNNDINNINGINGINGINCINDKLEVSFDNYIDEVGY
jgi:hypothetical protein